MGRQSRLKAARRVPPPPRAPVTGGRKPKTVILAASLALVIVALIGVGVLVITRHTTSSAPPPASMLSQSDSTASPALVKAAAAIGFHPVLEAGIGTVEDKPASAGSPASNTSLLAPGTTAPAFTLKTPQGQAVSLTDFRDKATLVEFFATWCPHCGAETPNLETIYKSLSHAKYAFVSINADGETAPSVFAYHTYFGLTFPSLLDPSSQPGSFTSPGAAGPVSLAYKVQSFPTFYVLNGRGVVTWASDGEQPNALLRQQLKKAALG